MSALLYSEQFLIFGDVTITVSLCIVDMYGLIHANQRLSRGIDITSTLSVCSRTYCILECKAHENCMAINFREDPCQCERLYPVNYIYENIPSTFAAVVPVVEDDTAWVYITFS